MQRSVLNREQKQYLLTVARKAIQRSVSGLSNCDFLPEHDVLSLPGASFVTLTVSGRLRGCIGSLEAQQPLFMDVWHNAQRAAQNDPRFPPVLESELDQIKIEISVLGELQPIDVSSEEELLTRIRPDIDGLLIDDGVHRATFLPSVWQQLPDPTTFLAHLKVKAGLAQIGWPEGIRCAVYQVEKWSE